MIYPPPGNISRRAATLVVACLLACTGPSMAWAQSCTDAGGNPITNSPCCDSSLPFAEPEIPHGTALTGVPGKFDLPFACEPRHGWTSEQSCKPAVALLPPLTSARQSRLFFWLPGLNNSPAMNEHILRMAAFAGYPVLAIPWDNQEVVASRCGTLDATGNPEFAGGICDPSYDCADIVRTEMRTGVDHPASPADETSVLNGNPYVSGYEGKYWSGIERRATRSLQKLHEGDHAAGWDAYCEPDDTHGSRLRWEDVVTAGFSMGAMQSQHTFYRHADLVPSGDASTGRLFAIEGAGDTCEIEMELINGTWIPDPATGQPAPFYYSDWQNQIFDVVSGGVRFAAQHADNPTVIATGHYHGTASTFEPMGFQLGPDPDYLHDYETTPLPLTSEVLETRQVAQGNGYHGSMADDTMLPQDATSGSVVGNFGSTDTAHLFSGYVEGMCSLGDYY